MNKFILFLGISISSIGFAQGYPSDSLDRVKVSIASQFFECGLVKLSGYDSRLSPNIRSRRVDDVWVRHQDVSGPRAVLLSDLVVENGSLHWVFSNPNGSFIESFSRDFQNNDFWVTHYRYGQVLWTTTSYSGAERRLQYWSSSRLVSEDRFEAELSETWVAALVAYGCSLY